MGSFVYACEGQPFFTPTGLGMNLFKSAVVCIAVVVICRCDSSQPTPPVATNNPTPVELPESADSIGMKFKLIPAGDYPPDFAPD